MSIPEYPNRQGRPTRSRRIHTLRDDMVKMLPRAYRAFKRGVENEDPLPCLVVVVACLFIGNAND
jgi:hypothetical protein